MRGDRQEEHRTEAVGEGSSEEEDTGTDTSGCKRGRQDGVQAHSATDMMVQMKEGDRTVQMKEGDRTELKHGDRTAQMKEEDMPVRKWGPGEEAGS
jgi:hypothetical protein